MGFMETTKMEQRKLLVAAVLSGDLTISGAARRFGVSRPTVRLWRDRALEVGIENLCEFSKRPLYSPNSSSDEIEQLIVNQRQRYPFWGARKILASLFPNDDTPVCEKTANRILKRNHFQKEKLSSEQSLNRFERSNPNELWQMDFKGLRHPRLPYEALSIIDDASRFCIALCPTENQSFLSVWGALWNLFDEYGLPDAILTDNGPAFRAGAIRNASTFDVALLKLGIRSLHGRPFHPQTQGKVERFHKTIENELNEQLRQTTIEKAREVYSNYKSFYNWKRPHDALGLKTPGQHYQVSNKKRPQKMPEHEIPDNSIVRKVDAFGNIGYKANRYKVGRAFSGEKVVITKQNNLLQFSFFGQIIGNLEDFKV